MVVKDLNAFVADAAVLAPLPSNWLEFEDEDGNPNMREGGVTNYFIFPGESGQDPAWLIGETVTSWRGLVSVAFEVAGKSFMADPFVLVPHEALRKDLVVYDAIAAQWHGTPVLRHQATPLTTPRPRPPSLA